MTDPWTADAVPGWQRRTLLLGHDAGAPLVATLVRVAPGAPGDGAAPPGPPDDRPAVLHVHGYND